MDNTENEKRKKQTEASAPAGTTGIRAALTNMGISNKSIGYDEAGGYVTINGRAFMKPTYIDEDAGISYASTADIQKNVVDFYKNTSNPVVRVSDAYSAAVGEYGLGSGGLSYGNGTVSIGGNPLNTMYIDESGKAWARQNDVYSLASDYVNSYGVESPRRLAEIYAERYLSDVQDNLEDLRNRESFSYNPDNDPVYLAYKNKYMQEGDRASRNTMANYSALTGGYANSAAVTAGGLANQYYAKQLTDVIPELALQAYRRYYDSYVMELDIADKMLDVYDKAYTNAYKSNNQTINNINRSAESVVDRDNAAYDRSLSEFEKEWTNRLNTQKLESEQKDNYWDDILNTLRAAELDLSNNGTKLSNYEKTIYLEYYKQLLESELASEQSQREKQQADIYKIYNK